MKRNEMFEKYPIPKAVWSLALPTMIGMLITVIYNMADTFFVGQLHDVNQVAAVSISMPIFMFLMAIGTIFGVGGGSYISRMLGMKEYEKVKEASSFSFYSAIFLGIICMILGLVFMPQILKISGASSATYDYAKSYLRIIALFSPLIILAFSLGQIARAEGAAKEAMTGMMLGTIINIILDPILILWLNMGVVGAAVATVFANLISVLYYCRFFMKKNSLVSISFKHFGVDKVMLNSVFSIGLPASLNSILMSASSIVLNNFAVGYSDNVVAAIGIVGRVTMLPILLLIGLTQGVQPLVAYNYAAKNLKRMKETLKYTIFAGTIIGISFTTLIYFIGSHAVGVFINNPEVIALGTMFIRINIISIPFLAILFTISGTFQSFGEGKPSLILSISRQGFVFIPVLFLMNKVLGLNGLVFAQPIADIASTLIAIYLLLRSMGKTNRSMENVEVA